MTFATVVPRESLCAPRTTDSSVSMCPYRDNEKNSTPINKSLSYSHRYLHGSFNITSQFCPSSKNYFDTCKTLTSRVVVSAENNDFAGPTSSHEKNVILPTNPHLTHTYIDTFSTTTTLRVRRRLLDTRRTRITRTRQTLTSRVVVCAENNDFVGPMDSHQKTSTPPTNSRHSDTGTFNITTTLYTTPPSDLDPALPQ